MHKKHKLLFRTEGMTILEVTVSLAIMALLSVTLTALIVYSIRAWSSGSSTTGASNASDLAIQKLSQDIRIASSASLSSGQLVLTVPDLITDANGEAYYDRNGASTVRRYSLSNGMIYRQIGAGASTVFARGISTIGFSVTGAMVTINVTGSDHVGTSISNEVKTARVVMRNYGS